MHLWLPGSQGCPFSFKRALDPLCFFFPILDFAVFSQGGERHSPLLVIVNGFRCCFLSFCCFLFFFLFLNGRLGSFWHPHSPAGLQALLLDTNSDSPMPHTPSALPVPCCLSALPGSLQPGPSAYCSHLAPFLCLAVYPSGLSLFQFKRKKISVLS